MHYHLEIIMPPTDNIEAAVSKILAPFNEQGTDEDGESNRHAFWDWYVIGGRFAGSKFQATLDKANLDKFYAELKERKVTVSGLTAGKQELKPESQIPMVDALWNEYFPQTNGGPCPLFNHANNQYKSDSLLPNDVMAFSDVPQSLEASRVILAAPNYNDELAAEYMVSDSIWNGVNYEDTLWDETFGGAVSIFTKKRAGYKAEYAEKRTPKDDWLVVTVDYHS